MTASALFHHDLTGIFSTTSLTAAMLTEKLKAQKSSIQAVQTKIKDGMLPALSLCLGKVQDEQIEDLQHTLKSWAQEAKKVIVLGTGGSSLGGKTVLSLVTRSTPGIHVEIWETIDPSQFSESLADLDPQITKVVVISKSGSTLETLAQYLVLRQFWQQQTPLLPLKDHFLMVCEDADNPLRTLAAKDGVQCLNHHPKIGGRFSVFSKVGMIPALLQGLDAPALRQGGQEVLEDFLSYKDSASYDNTPPSILGALSIHHLWQHHNITLTVMMPYLDRLESFAFWFRQLWAESLGKEGKGLTPIRALGPVDQHSQLQLYLDGPKDKLFTIIGLKQPAAPIAALQLETLGLESLATLAGKQLGDLLNAHQVASVQTFIDQKCPTRTLLIDQLDERTLGGLLMHFMLETILMAELMGIDAFDQPAVEHGKILAKKLLLA